MGNNAGILKSQRLKSSNEAGERSFRFYIISTLNHKNYFFAINSSKFWDKKKFQAYKVRKGVQINKCRLEMQENELLESTLIRRCWDFAINYCRAQEDFIDQE